jgi:hypothetical protein
VPGTTTNPCLRSEVCGGGKKSLEYVCLLTLYFSLVSMIPPLLDIHYKATFFQKDKGVRLGT